MKISEFEKVKGLINSRTHHKQIVEDLASSNHISKLTRITITSGKTSQGEYRIDLPVDDIIVSISKRISVIEAELKFLGVNCDT